MSRLRRCAALLAVLAGAAACTRDGGAGQGGIPGAPGTVDLAAAVGGDARLLDLAPVAGGDPVALLADGGTRSWLVEVGPGDDGPAATALLELPAVGDDAELSALPGGGFVVAHTKPEAGFQVLTVPAEGPATVTALGVRPERSATALSPDGRTLHAALTLPDLGPAQLLAVDLAAGLVATTASVVPEGTVADLAPRPDGGLAVLVETADGRAVLTTLDADLRPAGEPVELAPDDPAGAPADLEVTADGSVVATVRAGAVGRLVTVVDGALTGSVQLDGVGESALDVVLSPDGGSARVPRAGAAELVTVDLARGVQVAAVPLCGGAAVLGDVAPVGDGAGVVVTGSCAGGDSPQATAFVVG